MHVSTLPQLTQPEIDRFRSYVSKKSEGDCWPWTRAKDAKGYGLFKARQRMLRAARVAYFIANDLDPLDLFVCHRCDNPTCCNPSHLFLGTNRDNQIDARDKGRLNPPRGDDHFSRKFPERMARGQKSGYYSKPESFVNCKGQTHYAAKLTEQQVIEIRNLYAEGNDTMAELGAYYGIGPTTVFDIVHKKKWKHI